MRRARLHTPWEGMGAVVTPFSGAELREEGRRASIGPKVLAIPRAGCHFPGSRHGACGEWVQWTLAKGA